MTTILKKEIKCDLSEFLIFPYPPLRASENSKIEELEKKLDYDNVSYDQGKLLPTIHHQQKEKVKDNNEHKSASITSRGLTIEIKDEDKEWVKNVLLLSQMFPNSENSLITLNKCDNQIIYQMTDDGQLKIIKEEDSYKENHATATNQLKGYQIEIEEKANYKPKHKRPVKKEKTKIAKFICSIPRCKFATDCRFALQQHRAALHGAVHLKFPICGRLLPDVSRYKTHINAHCLSTCEHCDFVAFSIAELNRHKSGAHQVTADHDDDTIAPFRCSISPSCGLLFRSVAMLNAHVAEHLEPYYCLWPECRFRSPLYRRVLPHIAASHGLHSRAESFVGSMRIKDGVRQHLNLHHESMLKNLLI